MDTVSLTIDEVEVKARKGSTVLEAAQEAGIYIPSLCSHPDLPSSREVKPVEVIYRKDQAVQSTSTREHEGCQLCVVEVEGISDYPTSCTTPVEEGMVVHTNTQAVNELRQRNLSRLMGDHPHTCLTCAQREGCARVPCSRGVDYELRCCPLLGRCELQKVVDYIGLSLETPRYIFADLPVVEEEPLFKRNYNLCIGCTRCVRACQEVRGVGALGFVWQGDKAIVGMVAPSAKESECRYCGACVEVCPTGALTDLDTKYSGAALVRCREVCPAGVDVPRYVRLISEGKYADALSVVREKVPFPTVLGHVCAHPCENECRRGQVNEAVAICNLKRFAAEQDVNWDIKVAPATNKKVAIVGSGPAGMTAAYYLAKLGHSVTVYEALSEPGGMMRVGIPAYRAPRDIVKKEIDSILKIGIEIKLNTRVGTDITYDEIKQNNDAVFLATGAHLTRPLPIEGIGHAAVYQGVYMLHDTAMGKVPDNLFEGKKVVVIGGGNVAIDTARTALRLKAKEVSLHCLEADHEMPAHPWEIEGAAEEGVILNCSWGPKKICTDGDSVTGVEFKCCSAVFDSEGRFNPCYDEDKTTAVDADAVIVAIGQACDITYLGENSGVEQNRGGIKIDRDTMETNVKGVFSGGDVGTGPASVVSAIACGRKAAVSIDQYLGGEGNIDETLVEAEKPNPYIGRVEGFANQARVKMPCMGLEERMKGFVEMELGFNEEMALAEAKRCLQCDLRLELQSPTLPPETGMFFDFNEENIAEVPETSGVIQLYDEDKKIIYIAGAINMHQAMEELEDEHDISDVCYFEYEENDMYTKLESELMQQYMQEHGGLPTLNDDLPF